MAEPIALLALALDAAIGWPKGVYTRIGHPVNAFARIIDACELRWNRPDRTEATRRVAGIATIAILMITVGGFAWILQSAAQRLFGDAAWIAVALFAFPALAQRSLFDHVRPIAQALEAGDMATARHSVSLIVGRDTATLDQHGIARAAIESLAESFCDGIAAPLFWLLLLGLPGVWIYKALNTADSIIGHYEPRWRAFGWAAARMDDVANFIPARLGGCVIALAGAGGWRVMLRDARRHASPNAGWTEAAMAGALGVRLAGPVAYDGITHDKPWIGDGREQAIAGDIRRALRIYLRACAILWLIAGAIAWAL